MCGIAAFAGFEGKTSNVDKLKLLLFYNEERGKDSIGFYTQETGIIKKKGKPRDIMVDSKFNIPSSNLFIGHTRATTVGSSTDENAHPFERNDIILVMNGTLDNHWDLLRKYDLVYNDYNVDSDVLCGILGKTKSKNVLSEINGGCAVVYFNKENSKLYAYRNSDRPLYRGIIKEEGMYISSIKESLELIGCENVKEFKQDSLYEIENGEVKNNYNVKRYTTKVISHNTVDTSRKIVTINEIKYYNCDLNDTNNRQDLIGIYLKPKNTTVLTAKFYDNNEDITINSDMYYKCIGVSTNNTYSLILKNLSNSVEFNCSMYLLDNLGGCFQENGCVIANSDVKYVKNNISFCKKDDVLRIDSIKNNIIVCLNEMTGETCSFDVNVRYLIRPATEDEVSNFWQKMSEVEIESYEELVDSIQLKLEIAIDKFDENAWCNKSKYTDVIQNLKNILEFAKDKVENINNLEEEEENA